MFGKEEAYKACHVSILSAATPASLAKGDRRNNIRDFGPMVTVYANLKDSYVLKMLCPFAHTQSHLSLQLLADLPGTFSASAFQLLVPISRTYWVSRASSAHQEICHRHVVKVLLSMVAMMEAHSSSQGLIASVPAQTMCMIQYSGPCTSYVHNTVTLFRLLHILF
jgi:hypothetical protein